MPDPRLMWAEEVQSKQQNSRQPRAVLTPTFKLLFFASGAMDVIGTAATL